MKMSGPSFIGLQGVYQLSKYHNQRYCFFSSHIRIQNQDRTYLYMDFEWIKLLIYQGK